MQVFLTSILSGKIQAINLCTKAFDNVKSIYLKEMLPALMQKECSYRFKLSTIILDATSTNIELLKKILKELSRNSLMKATPLPELKLKHVSFTRTKISFI